MTDYKPKPGDRVVVNDEEYIYCGPSGNFYGVTASLIPTDSPVSYKDSAAWLNVPYSWIQPPLRPDEPEMPGSIVSDRDGDLVAKTDETDGLNWIYLTGYEVGERTGWDHIPTPIRVVSEPINV